MAIPPARRHALYTIALLLLVALAFGRVAVHEFVNLDDDKFISHNANLVPPTIDGLVRGWSRPHAHLYAPVTMTAWWLIAQVATVQDDAGATALNPWIFHIASLLVHAVSVLLVWRILRRIVRDDFAAALGAAIFAIHPLQAEAVAWASELKDLLAGMFSLLAIVATLFATKTAEDKGRRRWGWSIAAVICFAAALLSKPSAVTLPLVAAAILWALSAKPRAIAGVLGVGIAIAIPTMILARSAQPAMEVAAPALLARALVAADAVAFYLAKTVWPFGLGVDYGRTPAAVMSSGAIWWTWLISLGVTLAIVFSRRRVLVAAWIIFVVAAGANLGLLPFDWQAVSTVADHYVYVSMLGAALAVAWLVSAAPRARAPVAFVVGALAVISFVQAGHWRDSESLWRHAIDVNARSGLAYGNLGAALLDRGDTAGALPLLVKAAEIDPDDPFPQLSLTWAYLSLGDTAAATRSAVALAAAYQRRSDFDPALIATVLERFAVTIDKQGDHASAERLRSQARVLVAPTRKPR